MIDSRRLVVPREHLGVLIEPAVADIHACLDQNCTARLDAIPILDTTVGAVRRQLQRRLGLDGPVILTGRQAGFGHPGVFAKTIAADTLARRTGGTSVFLTVDSDVPKSPEVAVPQVADGRLERVFVPVPGCEPRLPTEWQPPVELEQWAAFFGRLQSLWRGAGQSLLPAFTDAWLATPQPAIDFCNGIIRAHAGVEQSLGLAAARDVRASQLCTTPEFRAFVAHLALHATAFATHYNQAQLAYRQRYRVRNAQRPAPPLSASPDRVELPFWVSRRGAPRRRLYVAERGGLVEFFADEEPIGTLARSELARAEKHEDPWPLEADGWHFRLRALTLSAFVGLFLADLFVHGIGGAKYDRMTEDLIRRFFGVELPPMCCVSATLYLPLPHRGVSAEELRRARRAARDVRYNPQRHLTKLPQDLLRHREELIHRSATFKSDRPHDHTARRQTFDEIRRVNDQLVRCDAAAVWEIERRIRRLEERWRQDQIARDREYFFALHRRSDLENLVRKVRALMV